MVVIIKNKKTSPKLLDLLDEVKIPTKGQRFLVFAPHPDDETIGAGGFIIESIRNGAEVKIILVTDGNKHGLKNKRYEEFKEAACTLGIPEEKLFFLNYRDGRLDETARREIKDIFSAIIKNFNPDVIVYPHSKDKHPDHRIVGEIIDSLLNGVSGKKAYKYIVHRKSIPGLERLYPSLNPDRYLTPPKSLIGNEKWEKLMLSEDAIDKKTKAVLVYKTQLRHITLRELLYSFIGQNEIYGIMDKSL